ncbi:hypothetical protein CTA1_12550 [Colletotrichum tanaceti]|uniref:Uncharacterized protein n=1 Tax=Colletotrichum tanaceti TaxID=1306861 RepID=A0A4U6XAC8_9PEZI|nr:hypothetical protein CTA1_12550 [Colletotrichum tanaceti]
MEILSSTPEVGQQAPLDNHADGADGRDGQHPLVVVLGEGGPEAVLVALVLLQLLELERVLLGVALLLAGLVLLVAPDVAEDEVVEDGAQGGERVQHAGAVEEDGEGEVAEGVAEETQGAHLLGVADDAPDALAVELLAVAGVVLQLGVGERLEGEAGGEQEDGQTVEGLGVVGEGRAGGAGEGRAEGQGEGQGDEGLQGGLGQEHGEEGLVPEPGVPLLGGDVAGVVAAALHAAGGDAVEEAHAPGADAREEQLLGVAERVPGRRDREAVVDDAGADGRPPGVGDLARGPQPVLGLGPVGVPRDGVRDGAEAGVEAEGGEEGVLEEAERRRRRRVDGVARVEAEVGAVPVLLGARHPGELPVDTVRRRRRLALEVGSEAVLLGAGAAREVLLDRLGGLVELAGRLVGLVSEPAGDALLLGSGAGGHVLLDFVGELVRDALPMGRVAVLLGARGLRDVVSDPGARRPLVAAEPAVIPVLFGARDVWQPLAQALGRRQLVAAEPALVPILLGAGAARHVLLDLPGGLVELASRLVGLVAEPAGDALLLGSGAGGNILPNLVRSLVGLVSTEPAAVAFLFGTGAAREVLLDRLSGLVELASRLVGLVAKPAGDVFLLGSGAGGHVLSDLVRGLVGLVATEPAAVALLFGAGAAREVLLDRLSGLVHLLAGLVGDLSAEPAAVPVLFCARRRVGQVLGRRDFVRVHAQAGIPALSSIGHCAPDCGSMICDDRGGMCLCV